MRDVVWTRAAEADLQAAYEKIEGFQEGAGHGFLLLIDAAVQLPRQFPGVSRFNQVWYYRFAVCLRTFPLFSVQRIARELAPLLVTFVAFRFSPVMIRLA